MSYVRITARRDDGLEVEFEYDSYTANYSDDGRKVAEQIRIAADKAIAAITAQPGAQP